MARLTVFDIVDPAESTDCFDTNWFNLTSGRAFTCNNSTRRYEALSQALATEQEVAKRVQVEVDFGADENSIARQYVEADWVTAGSIIDCDPAALPTDDHDPDDVVCEGLSAYCTSITPGEGFRIMVRAPTQTFGKYLINCIGR